MFPFFAYTSLPMTEGVFHTPVDVGFVEIVQLYAEFSKISMNGARFTDPLIYNRPHTFQKKLS